jgi:hypothetical protein
VIAKFAVVVGSLTKAAHSVEKSYRRQKLSACADCPAVASRAASSLVACEPSGSPAGRAVQRMCRMTSEIVW